MPKKPQKSTSSQPDGFINVPVSRAAREGLYELEETMGAASQAEVIEKAVHAFGNSEGRSVLNNYVRSLSTFGRICEPCPLIDVDMLLESHIFQSENSCRRSWTYINQRTYPL